ncbi:MAG TPA: DHHA1 domain-containing protein [Blastocatellia bacterium]|nr:DHHA1 domain-containing protein [Blastocatellia bacterium]
MQPTEKLYFRNASLLEFSASVLEVKPSSQGAVVVLDRTAFYPTGGGQPNDTGTLGNARVVDVFEDEDGVIYHTVESSGSLESGQLIAGVVDRARRLDHLQQHSGQHILSQAFVQTCGAETRSFHLGSQTSTIDIELPSPNAESMRAAEDLANAVVFEDRPMLVHLVNEEEAARLPLRKESAVRGNIRVIEIADFDWSPCGGTHASRTGQIGMIAIRSWERAKKLTRVEFVCGGRALADYRKAHDTASEVASLFSAERDSSAELVRRALQENKALKKRTRDLLDLAMSAEAAEMLEAATQAEGFKLVQAVFDGREYEEIRVLASKIVQPEPSVALLATKEKDAARLVFARSASLSQNMGAILAEACETLGGRGGGKPELAQGGGPNVERIEDAIRAAAEKMMPRS